MSRITAPVSKLSRSLNTASTRSAPLLDSHRNAGAALMPKYQELLHSRTRPTAEHSDSSRHLHMHHAPRPQPSISHRKKPLMQTFHTTTTTASKTPTSHMDAAVLPRLYESSAPEPDIYMPLLPDNYGAYHVLETAEPKAPTATILAANPENVVSGAPMVTIETVNLDGVELKWAHEDSAAATLQENERGFLGDIFRGMVDDVFGTPQKKTN